MYKIVAIWYKNKKIGYCHSINEADDICKKNVEYLWSLMDNNETNKLNLKFMTIHDYSYE
mgnify:CR=1 FL=1|tara:strand:+ start:530 stop:709 length:180 start_codon:yes stop_codon:yes gene_type:complete